MQHPLVMVGGLWSGRVGVHLADDEKGFIGYGMSWMTMRKGCGRHVCDINDLSGEKFSGTPVGVWRCDVDVDGETRPGE